MTLNYLLRTSGHQIPGRTLVPSPTNVSHKRTPPLHHPTLDPRIPSLAGSIRPAGQVLGHSKHSSAFLGGPTAQKKAMGRSPFILTCTDRTPLGFHFLFSRGLMPAEVATSKSGHCVDS